MVRDAGSPSRSATQLLIIQLLDVNDQLPRFDKSAYYFSVLENRPRGTAVGTVRATDTDASPAFSRVTYAIRQVRTDFLQWKFMSALLLTPLVL